MLNVIPNNLINQLAKDHEEIKHFLFKKKFEIHSLPSNLKAKKDHGDAFVLACLVQRVLKYHGFANAEHRIACFPSIPFNNNCAYTTTYLKFNKILKNRPRFFKWSVSI